MWTQAQGLAGEIKKQEGIGPLLAGQFAGKIYLVGGAIRELVLGGKPNDYDFVLTCPDDLKELERLFSTRAFTLGKKSVQTQRLVSNETVYDVTILKETIEKDLARRDFTMNAIAYDFKEDRVIDPAGGLDDIGMKSIRSQGEVNIIEDPLRMLKAVRHFAVLDGFSLEPDLTASIAKLKAHIHNVAPERVKYEMDIIMTSRKVFDGISLLRDTGLLFEIFPEMKDLRRIDIEKKFDLETFGHTIDAFQYLQGYGNRYGMGEEELRVTAYALLFHDLGKAHTFSYDIKKETVHFYHHERFSCEISGRIMERLRFSALETKTVLKLIGYHMRIFLISTGEATEKAMRRLVYAVKELTPLLVVHTLCDLYGSSGGKENPSTRRVETRCQQVMEFLAEWRKKPLTPLLNGNDLIAVGFTEGPLIGRVLSMVRDGQIAGEITTREEALEIASEVLKANSTIRY